MVALGASSRRTDGDLGQVVRGLFGSADFSAEALTTRKPKTSFEYMLSALQAAGAEPTDPAAARRVISDMGQPLYGCNPPTGYSHRGKMASVRACSAVD